MGPPAHGGIIVAEGANIRQDLVATDIERAKSYRPAVGQVEHATVEPSLGVDTRETPTAP